MKKFIDDNFIIKYKKSYGLNSVKLRKSWFLNNGFEKEYNNIIQKTIFLVDVSLSERIYCIVNDINKKNKCLYCKNDIKYTNYVEGYKRHCGDRKCSYIDKKTYKDKSGLTANEKSAKGLSKTQLEIQLNGKTRAYNLSQKNIKIKRNTILPNGLNILQSAALKSAETKKNTILPNGLSVAKNASLKAAKTMNKKLPNGKTIKDERIEKTRLTKSIIDDCGLDGFEKAFLNGAGKNCSIKYYNSDLYYQGTYEKHFLDFMYDNNFKNIKRGERFNYIYDNKNKQYRSDFMYNNIIFEVKSSWTYGKNHIDKRNKNHKKFESVINNGYKLFIILDKKYFVEVNKNNINNNLYDEKFTPIQNIIEIIN